MIGPWSVAGSSADRRTLRIGRNPVTSKFLLRFASGVTGFPSIAFQSRTLALPCRAIDLACPVHALSFSANTLSPRRKYDGLTGRARKSMAELGP